VSKHHAEDMEFSVKVAKHVPTGWMIATSDEFPELVVQGSNLQQIADRVPNVVRRILKRRLPPSST
jgi:hypothetical protein